ncbi:DNA-binding transcriptional LysR family regulator [Nonomuraea polychroma]|uniref:DNA-binding transcriptional LysR family regulator n=1 Tax=Nonomuraea polychroma TaxID=46176 RepID=A0A438MHU1_9ACTN|nr:LysR family transcriptional regulator [Nonomuraea polychroma]RVX45439.1 DNA-binding transcriptional LysR family regulator [Nonomuraea polychroma]
MELRQLRYFSVVAQEQHLTRAAERLGIRATSLSQQIITLERELGTILFHRTPGGMVPTAAGRVLLPHAHRALEAAHAGVRAVQLASGGEQAWRVGVTPGAPFGVVASLRAGARQANLCDLPVSRQLELLQNGKLDAGLIVLPADTGRLEARTVSDVPLGVLVSSRHPLAGRDELGWDDLDGQDLLWFDRELAPCYHDAMLDAFRAAGWRPRRVHQGPPRRGLFVAELTHHQSLVAIRPRWDLAGDNLAWLPVPDAPRLRHALVWSPSHRAAERLAGLAAYLAAEAAPHAGEAPPHSRTPGRSG